MSNVEKTLVGKINPDVLQFTAGKDVELDRALVEADCIGTAAHVTMLSRIAARPPIVTDDECRRVVRQLLVIMQTARDGRFRITARDQDVHLAVERCLTGELGELGKKVHTARSRNDQVAVDLRLYAKEQILHGLGEMAVLSRELLRFARRYSKVPMVGRTHMQPAMPSSVGLWASAHAESLLDDAVVVRAALELNDRCPLGSAAGYGVPLDIDRDLTAKLLGFRHAHHNVLYASNARGKCESATLSALAQVMLTLSRLAQDLIVYSMPEFGYFSLPREFCTGSSIMPQKNNPDIMELVRARASRVAGHAATVMAVTAAVPGGYSRDLQETKQPFMEGLDLARSSLGILAEVVPALKVDRKKLEAAFTPGVFATDRALELVGEGLSFREAYNHVKTHLDELQQADPRRAIGLKRHAGGTAGLDFGAYNARVRDQLAFVRKERTYYHRSVARLLDVPYPDLAS